MQTVLAEMWKRYDVLTSFKFEMNSRGWCGRDLFVLDVQIDLLKELIDIESMNALNGLLQNKTYFRLLKSIEKGIEYLPDILQNPEIFVLNSIDRDPQAWISDGVLIFICKNNTAAFSKISRKNEGAIYIDNRYQ